METTLCGRTAAARIAAAAASHDVLIWFCGPVRPSGTSPVCRPGWARAPIGVVTFEHKRHAHDHKVACETCHHPARAGMAMKTPHQACSTCHTAKPAAPMKTSNRDAFHDALARKGTCIDCHLDLNAKAAKKRWRRCGAPRVTSRARADPLRI